MNRARRANIDNLHNLITAARATLEDLRNDIETLKDEEQEAYEAMPESLQDSERGPASQTSAEELDSACSTMSDVDSSLEEVLTYLDNAKGES